MIFRLLVFATAELPFIKSRRAFGALAACGRRWRAVLARAASISRRSWTWTWQQAGSLVGPSRPGRTPRSCVTQTMALLRQSLRNATRERQGPTRCSEEARAAVQAQNLSRSRNWDPFAPNPCAVDRSFVSSKPQRSHGQRVLSVGSAWSPRRRPGGMSKFANLHPAVESAQTPVRKGST
jgi:hypothetical protein